MEMMSDFGVLIPVKTSQTFRSTPGQQVSIFCITPHVEVTTKGLRWEVTERRFEYWWEGTLNEAVDTEFSISFKGEARIVVYKATVDYKGTNRQEMAGE